MIKGIVLPHIMLMINDNPTIFYEKYDGAFNEYISQVKDIYWNEVNMLLKIAIEENYLKNWVLYPDRRIAIINYLTYMYYSDDRDRKEPRRGESYLSMYNHAFIYEMMTKPMITEFIRSRNWLLDYAKKNSLIDSDIIETIEGYIAEGQ